MTSYDCILYGAVVRTAVVGVMSGVLYGAVAVQQWLAQRCVCAATVRAAVVDVTCALLMISVGALSCHTTHNQMHMRNKARWRETVVEGSTMRQLVRERT